MIDLHCHSIYSDGTHTPEELIAMGVQAGLKVLALTDHDSMAGVNELLTAGAGKMHIINGIELSTRWKKHELHIIGLNIPLDDVSFNALIARQRENRHARALEIASKLASFGVEDAYEKACAVAGHEQVARPHFAKVLMNEGITDSLQSGFNRLLGRGKPAYVVTPWVEMDEAVKSIALAGGQAVIAHPLKYSLTRTKLNELIKSFKESGGVGMEVVSGETMDIQVSELVKLCNRYDLLASSGSDFHGEQVSRIRLGQQRPLPLNCTPIWNEWTF
ncbi:PHP domain-containing protein [Legionella impletisoli]|uniref:Phosphatase n=1 Tax=Legionella impletisoli TaxID=343510 RepID=A0A917JLM1_9GAMM|nr:PHP domain-containing protein [Legionella impletisoli]GGI75353.1 phosphatase [Legionella impletisoli]